VADQDSPKDAPAEGIGVGGVVEVIARPFKKLLRRGDCEGCKRRKAWLDRTFKIRIGRRPR
jgi:hypothetical protein